MPTYTINANTWSFDDTGTGTPIVLVHGFPLDRRVWAQVVPRLAKQRVIAVDLPGFGQSTLAKPFTIASLAVDLHQLLAHLRALPAFVGGLSMGGYVSLAFAKQFAGDMRGLILVDTKAAGDSAEAKAGRVAMAALVREKGSAAVTEQMLPKMLGAGALPTRPALARQLTQMMEACPAPTIAAACLAMKDRDDFTALLPELKMPVLIVVGETDAITPPAMAAAMRAAITGAKLAVIPAAGHLAPIEQPQLVGQAMAQFV